MKSEKLDFAILVVLVIAISYMHALRIEHKNASAWKKISGDKVSNQKAEASNSRVTLTKFLK